MVVYFKIVLEKQNGQFKQLEQVVLKIIFYYYVRLAPMLLTFEHVGQFNPTTCSIVLLLFILKLQG